MGNPGEMVVMGQTVDALEELSLEERRRVVAYLAERYLTTPDLDELRRLRAQRDGQPPPKPY